QSRGEETTPYSTATGVGVDVRADDSPPFGHLVRVAGPCPLERLEPDGPALPYGDDARDPELHVEVTLANESDVDRGCPQACAIDRVLYLGHVLGIGMPCGTDLNHVSMLLRDCAVLSTASPAMPSSRHWTPDSPDSKNRN